MDYYTRQYSRRQPKKRHAKWPWVALVLILVASGYCFFAFRHTSAPAHNNSATKTASQQKKEAPKPKPALVDLQPTVDTWMAKYPNIEFGIEVYDPANKTVIASHDPDQKFFAASLYKIFVAYLALVDFQKGAQDPNAPLTEGYTWKQCVDKMIRESYSPCGEAMMASMGQETLRQRVDAMGIHNTIFAGITTSAHDASLILQDIADMRDLTADNTAFLKDAMRVQDPKFRGGLPKGSPQATWETKVGWNEQYNYHDIGIMTLPDGRQYIVAILTQNNGSSAPIANFSATIYDVLSKTP